MSQMIGIILTILFVLFPKEIKDGALCGINNGIFILLPSIFPYIIIAQIFKNTGGSDVISSILYKPLHKVLNISKNSIGIYILSIFCGYPTGAKLSSELYEKNEISKSEMQRIFLFGNIGGFGFCVSYLGSIFNNIAMGIQVYFSLLISSVILIRLSSYIFKDNYENTIIPTEKKDINSLTDAIFSSTQTMINIIGIVTFFSAITFLIKRFIYNEFICTIASVFLEITIGLSMVNAVFPYNTAIYLTVFFVAFSGLSVIFQSLSFQKGAINIVTLIFSRVVFAVLSLLVFIIIRKGLTGFYL